MIRSLITKLSLSVAKGAGSGISQRVQDIKDYLVEQQEQYYGYQACEAPYHSRLSITLLAFQGCRRVFQ